MSSKIYFAHPVTDYNTEREARGVRTLELVGYEVINPNGSEHENSYSKEGMEYFKRIVKGCGALAFMRFPEGQIGAGVAKEIGWAHEEGSPVFELSDEGRRMSYRSIEPITLEPDVLSVDATRALIRSLRESV